MINDHWSKKIYKPQMIVDIRCYIHLRRSCFFQSHKVSSLAHEHFEKLESREKNNDDLNTQTAWTHVWCAPHIMVLNTRTFWSHGWWAWHMIILNTRTIWTHGWSKLSKNSVSNRCPALCATFCFHFQIDFKSWLRPHHPFRFIPDTIPLPFSEFSTKYTLCRHKHR